MFFKGFNSLLPKPPPNALSQWFLNLLSNQAKAAKLGALAWFDRILIVMSGAARRGKPKPYNFNTT